MGPSHVGGPAGSVPHTEEVRGAPDDDQPRFTLLGVGAMRSPRFRPAGLLVEHAMHRVAVDGGPGAAPEGSLDAWLVTDARCELMRDIRHLARERGLEPMVDAYRAPHLRIEPRPVTHTSHPTCGYLIEVGDRRVAWAPEFLSFPPWADGVDLLFAEAAGWNRPIRFAHGAGGHAAVAEVAREARDRGVRRLVFAHIGRPTIRALDAGLRPDFGEIGREGAVYLVDGG
jgi:hypothetical protein